MNMYFIWATIPNSAISFDVLRLYYALLIVVLFNSDEAKLLVSS